MNEEYKLGEELLIRWVNKYPNYEENCSYGNSNNSYPREDILTSTIGFLIYADENVVILSRHKYVCDGVEGTYAKDCITIPTTQIEASIKLIINEMRDGDE